ncbi:MAG: hypothetical protein PF904_05855 [Kiritimatiellae bacterium]|nr:hypothetical protein [Kiritimatiellia bacterium]
MPDLISGTIFGLFFFAFVYLAVFLFSAAWRFVTQTKAQFTGVGVLYWFTHWLAVCLYCSVLANIMMGVSLGSIIIIAFALVSLALAVMAQVAGCAQIKRRKAQLTEQVYRRASKWMLSAPLIVLLILGALALVPAL